MIFVDDQNKKIGDEKSEPDWSIWISEHAEEVISNEVIDIIMHCRKYTEEELKWQEEAKAQAQRELNLNIISDLVHTTTEQSDKLGYIWKCIYIGDNCVKKEYIKDANAAGTIDNPIEWRSGVQLIPNAYYLYDYKKYVYIGEPSIAGDMFNESDFELITW